MRGTCVNHVLESAFSKPLEDALNAPNRRTRAVRVFTGRAVVVRRGGARGAIRGAPAGTADMIVLVGPHGGYLELELKADGGRMRPAQRARAAMVRGRGGFYVVVTYRDADTMGANVARMVAEVDAVLPPM